MNLHKPARVPDGKTPFNALLPPAQKKACSCDKSSCLQSFLNRAHEYGEKQLMHSLGCVLGNKGAIFEIASKVKKNPDIVLFDNSIAISGWDELTHAANAFYAGRNALIPYYILTYPFSEMLPVPYQNVCEKVARASDMDVKHLGINALGVLGNLLPKEEKAKLAYFLCDLLAAEESKSMKLVLIKSLAVLHDTVALWPMLAEAEKNRETEIEDAASKAAMLVSVAPASGTFNFVISGLLFGNYSIDTKMRAATLMSQLELGIFSSYLNTYLNMMDETMLDIEDDAFLAVDRAIKKNGRRAADSEMYAMAAHYMSIRIKELGLENDVSAFQALAAYGAGRLSAENNDFLIFKNNK